MAQTKNSKSKKSDDKNQSNSQTDTNNSKKGLGSDNMSDETKRAIQSKGGQHSHDGDNQ